ncbi:neuroglian isoform X1 [Cotesia glomerata]|uniref:neuroglian isoform X1 n=1 Tax=Cotesia glomerata TaxID=32391 RepID=UPI001D016759|nr:neuroglian isoform X1 [Cotesia glomerata]XP_044586199.1 neuroglian isoform X1 [Cotesia glomerata]XP_044586208.1 neuroglian isoform X1 [Cotesia glomerata]XP_044586218.1 neuroglian isoform X1 [Cotesia glomerata]
MKCLIFILLVSALYVSAVRILGYMQGPSPPRMIKQPPTDELLFQVAQQNENEKPFVIECEAEGDPAPTYQWIKNGKFFNYAAYDDRMSTQPGRGSLVIAKPRDEDVGQYQCFAVNEWGTATSNSVFVRKAELNGFQETEIKTVTANEGDPFHLTCSSPDGWPKPNVYWLLQDYQGNIKSINNSRMTLDPEGTLWFSNVTRDDVSEDFYYMCMAMLQFRSELKLGNKILLNVISAGSSNSHNKHEPVRQYVTRKNEVAYRGKKAELFCIFGGTPLPEVIWSKDGERIKTSDRITHGNYGKSLILKRVDFKDEGAYTCEASNGVGRATSYSINLQVKSAPYFTVEPDIVNAAEDETATFHCEAHGVPKPDIKWIFNGKPIAEAPDNPRREIMTNSITIRNLTKHDTGNYGCNATNSNGYIYKDVYVNVQTIPAEINLPPMDKETVDGKNIIMTCRVTGSPKPAVKWIRNNQELTGGRYKTMESGDLNITNVGFMDSGAYTCLATNKFGKDEKSASLVVRERTKITDEPEDYEVYAGSPATFRCNAITDSTLELEIEWLRNNKTIDFEVEPHFVLTSDHSLTITKTTELDSGIYTCVAKTELDEATASATLTVQDKPNAPELKEIRCLEKEARVKWASMGDNRAPILHYIVEYNTSFTPDSWEVVRDDIPGTTLTFEAPMTPWANFTFRVIAVNKVGKSEPSLHSQPCTTSAGRPYKNPLNVMGNGTDPHNMVISWTAMPQIEHHAPRFSYRVSWREDIPGKEWNNVDISDWRKNRYLIENLPTYQRYQIKVVAINEIGEALEEPKIIIGYSGEDVPTQAPGNFTCQEVRSSTTAFLTWTAVPLETVRGELRGYKLQTWTEKDAEEGMREITIPGANTTQAIVDKFVPYTKNYVKILAFNGKYNGPPSEAVIFDTPEGVPGTILSLEAYRVGSSALFLMWNPPVETNGVLTGYRIYYQYVDGTSLGPLLERQPHVTRPEVTSAKLASLRPETKYRVHVRATTRAGEGGDLYIDANTERSKKPDVPRFQYQVISRESGYVTIKVIREPNIPGYPGSHFFARYKLRGETISLSTDPEFLSHELEIRGLLSGEIYVVSIVAVDGDYLTESDPQEIETSIEGPIIQPKENVATAGWFIGMMLAIVFLLMVLIIVCIIKRNRGGKYAVHERELAAGRGDYPEEGGFHEYSQPLDTKSAGGRTSLASSSHHDGKHPESDTDSMAEYGEGDTGRFTEDGSFIGQYGPKGRPDETPSIPTGSMATYV